MRHLKIKLVIMVTTGFLLFFQTIKATEPDTHSLIPLIEYLTDIAHHHHNEEFNPVPIIAIGGCPGVGKTYLTRILTTSLQEKGVRCTIIPLDHFNLSPAERKKIGTEWDIRHFKVSELHHVLFSISSGKKVIEKPTCNQLTGEMGQEFIDLNEIDLILFDGLYALCSEEPLNYFNYCHAGIFLGATEADIYNWKWEREQKKASPRTPQQFEIHMQVLRDDFHLNIASSKANALYIIQKDSRHSYQLDYQSENTMEKHAAKAA